MYENRLYTQKYKWKDWNELPPGDLWLIMSSPFRNRLNAKERSLSVNFITYFVVILTKTFQGRSKKQTVFF